MVSEIRNYFFSATSARVLCRSGTLVIIYNLKLMDTGEPELDMHVDEHDILLTKSMGDFDSDEG